MVLSSQSVARCQAETRARRTTSRPTTCIRIADHDVEHERGRQVSASGDHGGTCFERGGEPPLFGKSRARVFVQPGHGGGGGAEAFVGWAEDGIGPGEGQILHQNWITGRSTLGRADTSPVPAREGSGGREPGP